MYCKILDEYKKNQNHKPINDIAFEISTFSYLFQGISMNCHVSVQQPISYDYIFLWQDTSDKHPKSTSRSRSLI